jgi:hypothetical protein
MKFERAVLIIATAVAVTVLVTWYYAVTLNFGGAATVIMVAQTPDPGYHNYGSYSNYTALELHPHVLFDGSNRTMPVTLQLGDGTYPVKFQAVAWYKTPAPRNVTVFYLSQTSYITIVYTPQLRTFAITPIGLNATSVTARAGVTPVVWLNTTAAPISISGDGLSSQVIAPGGNYTHVYTSPGTFGFQVGSAPGTVNVV